MKEMKIEPSLCPQFYGRTIERRKEKGDLNERFNDIQQS